MPTPKPSSQPSRRQVAISLPASSRIAIAILTARSAGSGQGTGSLKNITRELIERALILTDQRPQRAVVLAQEVEHLLRLGGLRECRVTAQVAKHDDDLTAMAFENRLALVGEESVSGVTADPPPGQTGTPTHAHLHHRQRRNHAVPQGAGDTQ